MKHYYGDFFLLSTVLLMCIFVINNSDVLAEEYDVDWYGLEYIRAEPANPDASPEARAVLNYIHTIYGEKMLTGQMESGSWDGGPDSEMNYILENTGKLPAIRGLDFIHENDNPNVIKRAIEWWEKGGIPTIMWHWGAPTVGEGYEASKGRIDIESALTPGTDENAAMMADLDRIAAYLEELKEARVPIVWRPLHEVNGHWFWWSKGGPEKAIELWQFMFDYYTDEWELDNLIWAYCYADTPEEEWYPGDQYVDLAGPDTYNKGYVPPQMMFTFTEDIVGHEMPIIYHECGPMPDPEKNFEKGMTWAWFMNWHTSWLYDQPVDHLQYVYDHHITLTLDELPDILAPVLGTVPEFVGEFSSIRKDMSNEAWSVEYMLDDLFQGIDGKNLRYRAESSNSELVTVDIDENNKFIISYNAGTTGESVLELIAANENGRENRQEILVHVLDTSKDLAKYRPVEVSSAKNTSAFSPENINDGKNNTRWVSENGDEQWVIIDLEKERMVERVMLSWGEIYAETFAIEVSTDKRQWREVYKEDNGDGGISIIRFDPAEAQYIKLKLIESAENNGFSINQMTVFGSKI
ncbi:MAG: glycosyl hydrolase [Halanaerobiales bacterium]